MIVEGAVDKSKLNEFRTTNVALLKGRDELKQRFDGIDPDEAHRLMEAHQKAEEEHLLKGKTPRPLLLSSAEKEAEKERERQAERERIEGRVKSIKVDLEKHVTPLTTERGAFKSRLAAFAFGVARHGLFVGHLCFHTTASPRTSTYVVRVIHRAFLPWW